MTATQIAERMREQADRAASRALGMTCTEVEPRVLTEEVLIRSRMLLSDGFADALDARYGSSLVLFHPDTKLTFDARHWLWRRAARGDLTRTNHLMSLGEFYFAKMDGT